MYVGFGDAVLVGLACIALVCIIMWILAIARWFFAHVEGSTRQRPPTRSCSCADAAVHTAPGAPSAVWRVVDQPSGGLSVAVAV